MILRGPICYYSEDEQEYGPFTDCSLLIYRNQFPSTIVFLLHPPREDIVSPKRDAGQDGGILALMPSAVMDVQKPRKEHELGVETGEPARNVKR